MKKIILTLLLITYNITHFSSNLFAFDYPSVKTLNIFDKEDKLENNIKDFRIKRDEHSNSALNSKKILYIGLALFGLALLLYILYVLIFPSIILNILSGLTSLLGLVGIIYGLISNKNTNNKNEHNEPSSFSQGTKPEANDTNDKNWQDYWSFQFKKYGEHVLPPTGDNETARLTYQKALSDYSNSKNRRGWTLVILSTLGAIILGVALAYYEFYK